MFCLFIHESQGTMMSPTTGRNNSYTDSFYSSLIIKENRNFFIFFVYFVIVSPKAKKFAKFPLFVITNLKMLNVIVVIKMDITLWTRITMQSAWFVQQEVQQCIILLRQQREIHLIQRFWMFEFYTTTVS